MTSVHLIDEYEFAGCDVDFEASPSENQAQT